MRGVFSSRTVTVAYEVCLSPALPFGALAGMCWMRWTPALQRSAITGVRGNVRVMDLVPEPDMLAG